MSRAIDAFLDEQIDAGRFPGAVYAIGGPEGLIDTGARGHAALRPEPFPATVDVVYDLASLTKPLVTSLLYLAIGRDLGLAPDAAVRSILPEMDRIDKRDITVSHLLTHTSGLADWFPLYLGGRTTAEYTRRIGEMPPVAPPGTRVIYSDLGYILMGEILSRAATEPLDRLAGQVILKALGLKNTGFRPPADWLPRVAPTEDSCQYERRLSLTVAGEQAMSYGGFRTGIVRGEVHDQNAWAAGGVAGHAGLFSTAAEVAAIGREFLGTGTGLLNGAALNGARHDATPDLTEARSLAFRLAVRGETAAGPDLPPATFGHNGFTGTSIWIDPEARRVYVLLTNRVHPAVPDGSEMVSVRSRFHSIARTA